MDTQTQQTSSSASVFEASTANPQQGVALAVAEVGRLLAKYTASQDTLDRMQLLTEVEGLRRFVLVRSALLHAMQQPGSMEMSLGRELCLSLREMIGDVPELVKTTSLQGARNVERDTRRAIASLAFVGSLDKAFI